MEVTLRRDSVSYFKKIIDTSFTHEETMEMIVPDALPDILRIVDTDGIVLMRGKEAETDRVSVTGMVSAVVLYCPDGESGVRKLELSIPFSASVSAPGMSDNARVVTRVHIGTIDSRMINPRKILVRADVLIEILGFEDEEIMVSSDLDDAEVRNIEILRQSMEFSLASSVKEKTFVLSDEFSLPGTKPSIEEILKTRVALSADDVKTVGNKLIFKGTSNINILYRPEGGGELSTVDFSATFSQIIELESPSDDLRFDIRLMLTGMYIDTDMSMNAEGRDVKVELHMVAQTVAWDRKAITYISDTYSTAHALSPEIENFSLASQESSFTVRETIRESMEVPAQIKNVIDVHAEVGKAGYVTEGEQLRLRANADVTVMYLSDDGRILSVSGRYEVAAVAEGNADSVYSVLGRVSGGVFASPTGGALEIRLPVEFEVSVSSEMKFSAVSAIGYSDDEARDLSALPSVIVHHAAAKETLWTLAKNYNSTKELILAANELEDEDAIETGMLLIIPKRR